MRYNDESCTVECSARELCLYALRRGDIGAPIYLPDEIRDPTGELYYRLQSEAGAYYAPRVELYNTVCLDGVYLTVSVTADGIIRKETGAVVDKIKTVSKKGFFAPPDYMTLGLLKVSAYLLMLRDGLRAVDARVSYYNTDTKKIKYFTYRFHFDELSAFFDGLIEKIKYRARLCAMRANELIPVMENAVFPYGELRDGQEIMIRESFSTLKRGGRVFLEAPTGTGKTISALFPAVRALGRGYCDKVFYLTPKTSTRREAFSAAQKLYSTGTRVRTVTISAKEQICFCDEKNKCAGNACSPESCEYARGYYDRVHEALYELTEKYTGYNTGAIAEAAKKYRVCPYELSLDLSELCDVIICDYNYAFDPSVYLQRYFGEERSERYAFLVDEAHNLSDRIRTMYSAELSLGRIRVAAEKIDALDTCADELRAIFDTYAGAFEPLKKLCRDTLVKDDNGVERGFYLGGSLIEAFNKASEKFRRSLDQFLYKNQEHYLYSELNEVSSAVRKYLRVCEYFDKSFRLYVKVLGADITVKCYCLDPSEIMDTLLMRARGAVLFSATLTPAEYFKDVLGGKNAEYIALPSPFESERLCVAVADYVNMRYDGREKNARSYATLIAATVKAKRGNYIAYFPSYKCLEQVYEAFTRRYPRVQTVKQSKNMTAAQKKEFLSRFAADEGVLRVGFCVLGGLFSEGVDLPGSQLIGSIIFGVGLPSISEENNIIMEYYNARSDEGEGQDYAYTYPGMNNVLQAAGRVIRRNDDTGVVVLADDRYATPKYRALFPAHWKGVKYAGNASSLAEIMRRFWENQP